MHKEGWLVIDEIGPLELSGEGFHDVLKEVLSNRSEKIILVIRDGIAERVKEYFNVTVAAIINNPGLISD